MTVGWSVWKQLRLRLTPFRRRLGLSVEYGVYQIRIVDEAGKAIPVQRIGGVDKGGIIYIGRSGYPEEAPKRTIENRIREFYTGNHVASGTYELMAKYCESFRAAPLSTCKLESRKKVIHGDKREIDSAETIELARYFVRYGELPPLNGKFPHKWEVFEPALKAALGKK